MYTNNLFINKYSSKKNNDGFSLYNNFQNKIKSINNNIIWYNIILSALLMISLAMVIWIKSRNFIEFKGDYILITYTIFVTLFQLFRLTSALFFKHSLNSVISSLPQTVQQMTYEPFVSFVIPCKNEEKDIHKTIRKCYEADYPKDKLEVIVINDGSTDRTGKILRELKRTTYPSLTIINWKKNRGKRCGMDAGFRVSKGEIIVQLDSDSYIQPETFRHLIEPFKNPQIGAVCAHTDPENADQNIISKMQTAYYFMAFRVLKSAESTFGVVFCCSGCSSAYRRDAVMPILKPWLNETFLGQPVTWGDDRALTSWVIKCGYKTIYTDRAKAVTIVPSTFSQLMKQQIRWKKSWIINAIFTGKFIWKKEPFVAFIYYYPLIIISLFTPVMAARALVYNPIAQNGFSSLSFYILGILLITSLLVIYCKFVSHKFKYWPYLFLWSGLNIFLLSFLLFYSAATIQNRSWGTR